MPKYLVPVRLTKLGYAEVEGENLEDALQYCHPDYADVTAQRDSEEGWFYDGSEPCKRFNEKTGDWEEFDEDDEEEE